MHRIWPRVLKFFGLHFSNVSTLNVPIITARTRLKHRLRDNIVSSRGGTATTTTITMLISSSHIKMTESRMFPLNHSIKLRHHWQWISCTKLHMDNLIILKPILMPNFSKLTFNHRLTVQIMQIVSELTQNSKGCWRGAKFIQDKIDKAYDPTCSCGNPVSKSDSTSDKNTW